MNALKILNGEFLNLEEYANEVLSLVLPSFMGKDNFHPLTQDLKPGYFAIAVGSHENVLELMGARMIWVVETDITTTQDTGHPYEIKIKMRLDAHGNGFCRPSHCDYGADPDIWVDEYHQGGSLASFIHTSELVDELPDPGSLALKVIDALQQAENQLREFPLL